MNYSEKDKKLLLEIGSKIRFRRKQLSFSQEKLAFLCELDRTYIGSIERGERNISIINLAKISSSLDLKLDQLTSEIEYE